MIKHFRIIATAMSVALLGGLALSNTGCAVGFRVYDPEYRDYHRWNGGEESVFRVYLDGRHEPYRKFPSLNRDEQRAYWKWRHERSDADHRH
jgi:hypothetical protein